MFGIGVKGNIIVLENKEIGQTIHISSEAVFSRDALGRFWSKDIYGSSAWAAYLRVFDFVQLVVRVENSEGPALDELGVEKRISVTPLPFYKGAKAFLLISIPLVQKLWIESKNMQHALLRLPGPISSILGLCLILRRKHFAAMVVGDVNEVLATGNFDVLTKLTRLPLTYLTQAICRRAKVISYVTEETLQTKYPPNPVARIFSYSDVSVSSTDFAKSPRQIEKGHKVEAVFCGSLAQLYKGLDILIEAVHKLPERRGQLHITVIGDGVYRATLEQQAKDLGVDGQFTFLGHVSRDRVFDILGNSDLFLMPSRTEGLPRAMIEAMAKGLGCIGSRVGGIPELLNDIALVEPDNSDALANTLEFFLGDASRLNAEAARNLSFAKKFERRRLDNIRQQFLEAILAAPEEERT